MNNVKKKTSYRYDDSFVTKLKYIIYIKKNILKTKIFCLKLSLKSK